VSEPPRLSLALIREDGTWSEEDPPGELEGYQKEQEPYIGDLEAARHHVYWIRLNKPREDASPADQLRASFIDRLHEEVRYAIQCIKSLGQ